MNPLTKIALGLVVVIILIVITSIASASRIDSLKYREQYEEELIQSINAKREQLNNLTETLNNSSKSNGLPLNNATVKVLDIYEQSNIRIPVDIIEELYSMRITNPKDIFDFIENQRDHWKIENNKKPYRKVS